MNAKCERCGMEFELGEGIINMTCQKCGCQDLKFDSNLILTPLTLDGQPGPVIDYQTNGLFCGGHQYGTLWDVKKAVVIDSNVSPDESKNIEEEKMGEEKPTLLKPKRKLRVKIGP